MLICRSLFTQLVDQNNFGGEIKYELFLRNSWALTRNFSKTNVLEQILGGVSEANADRDQIAL